MNEFFSVLKTIPSAGKVEPRSVLYIERFTELMIDLVAQLPTRRFFHAFLSDSHFVVKCRQSKLSTLPQGRLFNQLLDILKFYEGFEINDLTGNSLSDAEMSATHADRIQSLQRIAFKHFEELKELALANIASVDKRPALIKHLNELDDERLRHMCVLLNLLPELKVCSCLCVKPYCLCCEPLLSSNMLYTHETHLLDETLLTQIVTNITLVVLLSDCAVMCFVFIVAVFIIFPGGPRSN